jgi:hypothetical protein
MNASCAMTRGSLLRQFVTNDVIWDIRLANRTNREYSSAQFPLEAARCDNSSNVSWTKTFPDAD